MFFGIKWFLSRLISSHVVFIPIVSLSKIIFSKGVCFRTMINKGWEAAEWRCESLIRQMWFFDRIWSFILYCLNLVTINLGHLFESSFAISRLRWVLKESKFGSGHYMALTCISYLERKEQANFLAQEGELANVVWQNQASDFRMVESKI